MKLLMKNNVIPFTTFHKKTHIIHVLGFRFTFKNAIIKIIRHLQLFYPQPFSYISCIFLYS